MKQAAQANVRQLDMVGWGAIAAMAAGTMAIVEVLVPAEGPAGSAIFLVFLLLLIPALMGFHRYQHHAYGRITTSALYLTVAGVAAQAVAAVGGVLRTDALQPLDNLGSLALLLGFIVYGGSTARGRALPRWCGAAFLGAFLGWVILAITLGDTGGLVGGIWFGLLWIALGGTLWTRRHTTTN